MACDHRALSAHPRIVGISRIVPDLTGPAHAADNCRYRPSAAGIVRWCTVAALIRVVQQRARLAAALDRHQQRVSDPVGLSCRRSFDQPITGARTDRSQLPRKASLRPSSYR